jgi:hypothetical protein
LGDFTCPVIDTQVPGISVLCLIQVRDNWSKVICPRSQTSWYVTGIEPTMIRSWVRHPSKMIPSSIFKERKIREVQIAYKTSIWTAEPLERKRPRVKWSSEVLHIWQQVAPTQQLLKWI